MATAGAQLFFSTEQNSAIEKQSVTLNAREKNPAREFKFSLERAKLLSKQFFQSENLRDFTEGILHLAEDGDMDAQYYLAKAYKECARSVSYDDHLAMVHALETQNAHSALIEKSRREYQRCLELDGSDTESSKWLQLAREAGHPILVSEELGSIATEQGRTMADELAVTLLKLKDPEVILNVGNYLINRDSGKFEHQKRDDREYAFLLLACEYGFHHCEPLSPMMLNLCSAQVNQCDPSTRLSQHLDEHVFSWSQRNRVARLYDSLSDRLRNEDYAAVINP